MIHSNIKKGKFMNKYFSEVLTSYGMNIKDNTAYGNVKGFETNAQVGKLNQFQAVFHISFYASDEQRTSIINELNNLHIKNMECNLTHYGIVFGVKGMSIKSLEQNLTDIFDMVFGTLRKYQALGKGYCPICGTELDENNSTTTTIDGYSITISNNCLQEINQLIEKENEEFKNAPNNYFKGFLGALCGGFIGFIIALALYYLGLISALSAFVAVALGSYFYTKFGGKQDKVMLIILSCTTLVFMSLSIFAVYVIASGIAVSQLGYSMSAFEAFFTCMRDEEFSSLFFTELVLTIIFSIAGMVWKIVSLKRAIKRPNKL